MTLHNLLKDPIFGVRSNDGKHSFLSLPEIYSNAQTDNIAAFTSLRPHQWQAWHCFLAQCAALALTKNTNQPLPEKSADWETCLRKLTPDYANDEPWCLTVKDIKKPAFMQAPSSEKKWPEYKTTLTHSDDLDMLVTSKNHDLKQSAATFPQSEDWAYSLINLQTMEGFLGSGNYGISRMNGGFSNRCFVGLAPAGGLGAHIYRDIRVLLSQKSTITHEYKHVFGKGRLNKTCLLWLLPWDGTSSLPTESLDPYYIEICRRIRFITGNKDQILAKTAGSKKPRILAKELNGNTGDPWAPLQHSKDLKSVTITNNGFHYRTICKILFDESFKRPLMALANINEKDESLVFSALVRGQGKTEGLHHRRIPFDPSVHQLPGQYKEQSLGELATERVETAGDIQKILRQSVAVLCAGAPGSADGKIDFKSISDNDRDKALVYAKKFDQYVDSVFFSDLWIIMNADEDAQEQIQFDWELKLIAHARKLLTQAAYQLPRKGAFHRRARTASSSFFNAVIRKNYDWLYNTAH